ERDDVLPLPIVPGNQRARLVASEVEKSFCPLLVVALETVRPQERLDLIPEGVLPAAVGGCQNEQDERTRQQVARESGRHHGSITVRTSIQDASARSG